jgi:hypothetical protein
VPVKDYPIDGLEKLVARHYRATGSAALEIAGRRLQLLYELVANILSPAYGYTVVIVDVDGRFDATRLMEVRLPAQKDSMSTSDNKKIRPSGSRKAHMVPPRTAITRAVSHSPGRPAMILTPSRTRTNVPITPTKRTATPKTVKSTAATPTRRLIGLSSIPSLTETIGRDIEEAARNRHLRQADLKHLHIYRVPTTSSRAHIREVVASAEEYMIYGTHSSKGRPWWGTIVIGGGAAEGLRNPKQKGKGTQVVKGDNFDVTAAWAGWMKVEKGHVPGFMVGASAEEAMRDRRRRQEAVEASGWIGKSVWGDTESFGRA